MISCMFFFILDCARLILAESNSQAFIRFIFKAHYLEAQQRHYY